MNQIQVVNRASLRWLRTLIFGPFWGAVGRDIIKIQEFVNLVGLFRLKTHLD